LNAERILLFSILFLILIIGLFYYVVPNVFNPLRIDKIPDGTYIVPWMSPEPWFGQMPENFSIDVVMTDALKLYITFRIDMWDGTTRTIPSTVYLGHDKDFLYVGGKFVGMYSNPASVPGDTQPNVFDILFDVTNSGVLKSPESGSGLAVNIGVPKDVPEGYSFADMTWQYEPHLYKRMIWLPADNYLGPPNFQQVFAFAAHAIEYDNSTGTVTMLFARFLSRSGTENINALQMRPGERWVMGFVLELWYQKERDNRFDGWPRNIYPYESNDSSWWPKMVIDLTNPPSTISSHTPPNI
jgi:hypothetical protein